MSSSRCHSSSSTASEDYSQSPVSSKFKSSTSDDVECEPNKEQQRNSATEDEAIMKRRLMIDGTNNDKRLTSLTKNFVAFCDAELAEDDDPRDLKIRLARLVSQIKQVEFDARKTHAEIIRAEEEKMTYASSAKSTMKDRINAAKKQLAEARNTKLENTNRLVCLKRIDGMSKILLSQPDRLTISKQLEQAKSDLKDLEEKQKRQENQVDFLQSRLNLFAGLSDLMEEFAAEEKEQLELETQIGLEGNSDSPSNLDRLNEPEMSTSAYLPEAMEVMNEIICQIDNLELAKLDSRDPNEVYGNGSQSERIIIDENDDSFNIGDELQDEASPPKKRTGSKFSRQSGSDGSQ